MNKENQGKENHGKESQGKTNQDKTNRDNATILSHGTLMDVFGVGVLITGKPGIGKSETALELVQRGHRLNADDAVFFRKSGNAVVGSAPDLVRYMMEIRGIGIINIWEMYGSGAVKLVQELDLIVELEEWVEGKDYARMPSAFSKIHDRDFPKLTIPVRPGRNIAAIIEVAAKSYRLKHMHQTLDNMKTE